MTYVDVKGMCYIFVNLFLLFITCIVFNAVMTAQNVSPFIQIDPKANIQVERGKWVGQAAVFQLFHPMTISSGKKKQPFQLSHIFMPQNKVDDKQKIRVTGSGEEQKREIKQQDTEKD